MSLLRIAAIDFLNPAPLMWNFEHAPEAERLRARYSMEKMTPSACAEQLRAGEAELGLIPIAEYASIPGLAVVAGCTIASLGAIRSILLVMRAARVESRGGDQAERTRAALPPGGLLAPEAAALAAEPDMLTPAVLDALRGVKAVALDTASRTSAMYTQILFAKYWGGRPRFIAHAPALDAMLRVADAALLIGDPALFALEDRLARESRTGERLYYLDLGAAWQAQTGLPWVSAFWAARTEAPAVAALRVQITEDCIASRDAGRAHLPALTREWSARLGLPAETIAAYLGRNIHYDLDQACLRGVAGFYADAAACGLIAQEPRLQFL